MAELNLRSGRNAPLTGVSISVILPGIFATLLSLWLTGFGGMAALVVVLSVAGIAVVTWIFGRAR